jgi:hypothetical protein
MTALADDPFARAVKPLVDAIGGEMLPAAQAGPDDVVLTWRGEDALAVRLPQLADSLDRILASMEREHGRPLAELDRRAKQRAVQMLEARGAFSVRHGVETVAGALGVSRFTVYNYLNFANEQRAKARSGDEQPRHGD